MRKTRAFDDLPQHEQAAMTVNTALEAQASGLPLVANEAKLDNITGILIWIPGYTLKNGAVVEAT